MKTTTACLTLLTVSALNAAFASPVPTAPTPDPRHLSNGWIIPDEHYADQPYIVKTDDGAWLCAITTGSGNEGAGGQHVVSMRSTDRGRTWEKPVDIEPASGPEASYVVLLKTPYGRVYALYNHNTDRVPEVKREDSGVYKRVDSLGHYVFKYTDNHGQTWSERRYEIPLRAFDCDLQNAYKGELKFFWNVGKPLLLGSDALCVIHKVGAMGAGFFAQSEGAFLKSPNILSERDPAKITFETLPEGTVGLRTPPAAAASRRSRASSASATAPSTASTAPSTAGPPARTAATARAPGPRPPTRPTRPAAAASSTRAPPTSSGSVPTASFSTGSTTTADALSASSARTARTAAARTTTATPPGSWPAAKSPRQRAARSSGPSPRSCSTTTTPTSA